MHSYNVFKQDGVGAIMFKKGIWTKESFKNFPYKNINVAGLTELKILAAFRESNSFARLS